MRRASAAAGLALAGVLLLTGATPPPVGAYAPTGVTAEVREAAAFAVRERAQVEGRSLRLLEVASAERQVVAGLNFRMTLRVAQGHETRQARVVVYRPLQGGLRLTAWEWTPR